MRKLWFAVLALAFVATGIHLAMRRQAPEWTTTSAEALAEFELALDAEVKFYRPDAVRHLRRALELDPNFVAPKMWLQYFPDQVNEKERELLFEELQRADLAELTPRERFILSFRLANREKNEEKASRILEQYLAEHPEDPWALRFVVSRAWNRRQWEEAERLYKKLIELDPNWVLAHNHLGYIYMAQGRFAESEEAFRTYRFIAPDQANPHDSLGELLTLRGRYQEAVAELEEALRSRADFCASYEHMFLTYELWGRPADARATVDRAAAQEGCPSEMVAAMRCREAMWDAIHGGDWERAWTASQSCDAGANDPVLRHLAAVRTGRLDEAVVIEQDLAAEIEKIRLEDWKIRPRGLRLHLEGARLMALGRSAEAAARFAEADALLSYWTDEGIVKLYNLTRLADAQLRAGDLQTARAALARVQEVNPRFAPVFMPAEVYAALAGDGAPALAAEGAAGRDARDGR